jgi:hypothetical protein
MKFLLAVISTALLAYAGGIFLPWWSVAIAGFISGIWLLQKPGMSFLSSFTAVFLLWGGFALFRSQMNDDILATRFALLILKSDNPLMLVLLTGMIGGLVSGLGSLSGSLGRTLVAGTQEETASEQLESSIASSDEQNG